MSDPESGFQIEPTPRPPRSTASKVLLGFAVVGGLALLVCCGGGYYVYKEGMSFTQDPAEVRNIANEIAFINLPETYEPEAGFRLNLGMKMQTAMFKQGDGGLFLMQMQLPGNPSQKEMEKSFREKEQQQQQSREIDVESREKRSLTIEGKPYEFEFTVGKMKDSGKPVHQVAGMFPGRNGMAFLTVTHVGEDWNEAETIALIESIKTTAPNP
ncbi:hypothetical protein [Planctomicrobium sp. SH664]|uniref:hypothetical protein n=1 Tax=Planctomicrobium sp. SH664 TaxID=3448125 RepID=UPI003F5B62CD